MIRIQTELGPVTLALFDRLVTALETINERINHMALDFTELTAKVAKIDGSIASAVLAFHEIADALANAAGDQAQIAQLAADLDQHADALAAAIPATPSTPPSPTP